MSTNNSNIDDCEKSFIIDGDNKRQIIAFMWENPGYKGQQYYLTNVNNPNSFPIPKVNSIKVAGNYAVILYSEPNYGGHSETFKGVNNSTVYGYGVKSYKVFTN